MHKNDTLFYKHFNFLNQNDNTECKIYSFFCRQIKKCGVRVKFLSWAGQIVSKSILVLLRVFSGATTI